jgi:tRNA-dihydrouridine synthase
VVQLMGHERGALVLAARVAQEAGAAHINLNMGCPYGRMGGGLTGGGMLRRPDNLAEVIPALREAIDGSFSVKIRTRSWRCCHSSSQAGWIFWCCIPGPWPRSTTELPTMG